MDKGEVALATTNRILSEEWGIRKVCLSFECGGCCARLKEESPTQEVLK